MNAPLSSAAARYHRALACFNAMQLAEARVQLESLVRDEPQLLAAKYLLGDTLRHAGAFADSAESYGAGLMQDLSIDAKDHRARVEALVDFVARRPPDEWRKKGAALRAYGAMLQKSGFDIGAEGLAVRLAASPIIDAADGTFTLRLAAVCDILAINKEASREQINKLVQAVLLPWLHRALEAGQPDNALELENLIYSNYVVAIENEEHYRAAFGLWLDEMRAAGKRFASALPEISHASPGALPRIGFFVHNLTLLAHTSALLEVLEGHAELAQPIMQPYLFCITGHPQAVDRFRRAGVRVELLAAPGARMISSLVTLRRRIAEEGIAAIAWISVALMMAFAFGMRIAPRQVWWAMKYHSLDFPEIDDYLTGGGETGIHEIRGRLWRVGPVVAGKWYAPELATEAHRVRASLGAKGVVFGCLGRTEKLDNPAFLDAVVEILRAQPDALFLWTGRSQASSIQQHFEAAGVADRTRFIGWVNTKLYAQVIDIFLDSFPFPGGFTVYEAMAAGKPPVLFDSRESSHGGINAIVGPLLRFDPSQSPEAALAHQILRPAGESLYLRASNVPEYVRYALKLARDTQFRVRVGAASRDFIETVMTDRRRAARIYVDHLLGRDPAPDAA